MANTYVPIELSGDQSRRLREALESAFESWDELAIFVKEQLDAKLASISAPTKKLPVVVHELIEWAQSRGLGGNLVSAARLVRPGNPKIQAIAAELLAGDITAQVDENPPTPVVGSGLERIVRKSLSFEDAELWWRALGTILPRVCLVEVDLGTSCPTGTGFLVGRDVVLTNHHVVQSVIDLPDGGTKIRCVFDYKRVRKSKVVVNEGTAYALDDDWLIDASPPSPFEDEFAPAEEPSDEQLDYALLRLAEPVADIPLGNSADPQTPKRGYVPILNAGPPPAPGSPLYIVQHPKGEPVQVALDSHAVLWVKSTRLRYRTNTEPGSSGSPCFDAHWNPVALHHWGDLREKARFNQGIPLTAIVALLKKRGKSGVLGR